MTQAFLSHSSCDKDTVTKVHQDLNAANVICDTESFDAGRRSADEIFRGLSTTDVFVLFISRRSTESPWVRSEIALAQQKLLSRSIRDVLVFVLDDCPVDAMPLWLRDFVYVRERNPVLIAIRIRSRLFEIALETGEEFEIFLGRDKDLNDLKTALSKPSADTPKVIFLSGSDGIGRRTLARRALKDTYPWFQRLFPEVTLTDTQGPFELYQRLLQFTGNYTLAEWTSFVSEFRSLNVPLRVEYLVRQVEHLRRAKQVLFLRGHSALMADDGTLQEWLLEVVKALPKSNIPVLVIISRRMMPFAKRQYVEPYGVFFCRTESLSLEHSKALLSQWLKKFDLDFSSSLLDQVTPFVAGHPKNIELAAKYAAHYGIPRLETDKRDFRNVIGERAAELLYKIKFDTLQELSLALFSDYEHLGTEDIVFAFKEVGENDNSAISSAMAYLQDHGIIEAEGKYLRLAPYLIDAASRHRWSQRTTKAIEKVRAAFYTRVSTLETGDYVRISTIDAALVAGARAGRFRGQELFWRILLPSHILRVARDVYDDRRYPLAAELCEKAMERAWGLTSEAILEGLRLRGLSLARLGRAEDFNNCITQLHKIKGQAAQRQAHFLKGFKCRWEGQFENAEREYRKAYAARGARNFHVLRELAQVLAAQSRYEEAERYARAALKIAPLNAYVIDNLVEILIEKHKGNAHGLAMDEEISSLFQELEKSSMREHRSFYQTRMAHYLSMVGDLEQALQWADRAIEETPNLIQVYYNRARIKLKKKDLRRVEEDIRKMESLMMQASGTGDKRHHFLITLLKYRLNIELKQYDAAKNSLYGYVNLPRKFAASSFATWHPRSHLIKSATPV